MAKSTSTHPAGTVFKVEGCELSKYNGYWREDGVFNGKPQYKHIGTSQRSVLPLPLSSHEIAYHGCH